MERGEAIVRSRLFIALAGTVLLSGCGQAPPIQAGGKPVSYWIGALQDADPNIRKAAVFKLGNVGSGNGVVVPALLGALNDAEPKVRREAILALMKCGPAAKEAIPVLRELRQDPDEQVRTYAGKGLTKLEQETVSAK
jgi:HEAT repeat protein